jgi:uncharacterized membrane protein
MNWSLDWRWAVALCALSWGLWAFFGKISAARLGWPTASVLGWLAGMAVVLAACLPGFRWPGWAAAAPALAYGIFGAAGALLFVRALEQGPAMLVAPLAETYLVITVLLAVLFLGEAMSLKRLLGLALILGGAALLAAERAS